MSPSVRPARDDGAGGFLAQDRSPSQDIQCPRSWCSEASEAAAAAQIFQGGGGAGMAKQIPVRNYCPVDSEFGLGEVEDSGGGWWCPLCQRHGTEHFKVVKLVTVIMDI